MKTLLREKICGLASGNTLTACYLRIVRSKGHRSLRCYLYRVLAVYSLKTQFWTLCSHQESNRHVWRSRPCRHLFIAWSLRSICRSMTNKSRSKQVTQTLSDSKMIYSRVNSMKEKVRPKLSTSDSKSKLGPATTLLLQDRLKLLLTILIVRAKCVLCIHIQSHPRICTMSDEQFSNVDPVIHTTLLSTWTSHP